MLLRRGTMPVQSPGSRITQRHRLSTVILRGSAFAAMCMQAAPGMGRAPQGDGL